MKKLIIRLGAQSPEETGWAEIDADGAIVTGRNGLAEIAARVDSHRIIALIPGTEVLLTRVTLPRGNRKRLLAAVPYALEESLAAEIEDQHFALGSMGEERGQAVAVITRERMDYWLAMLREVGIEPAFLTPEMMALPLQPSRRSVLLAENLAFVRSEAQDGFVLEVESLPMLLAGWEDKDREQVADVLLFRCDTEAILPDEVKRLIAEEQPVSEPLSLLAGGFDEKTAINLLQGFYSPHAQWELHWNRWRLPAALLLVFMVFQVGLQVRDYFQLRNYNQLLSAQIEQVYRQAFPDADRIVNPRAQMEHRLQSLRGAGEGEHNGFLALLGQAGPLLVAAENFHLRGLRYRENDLDLDFEIKDLRGLEILKDGLTAQGLAVDIRTATTRGDRVQARLQIKEARP